MDATTAICIVIGSAAGGAARYAVSEWIARRLDEQFPWGTLVVNLSGAAAIGLWLGAAPQAGFGYAVFVLGFLGSYTTVSTFALQSLFLSQEQRWGPALGYVALSALGCLAAASAGLLIARALTRSPSLG
ncbi:MAG: CrcB family protein [Gammaproteobacteria bacterium]|nr:MAG: CrcB family protein [Gammaproteobacteria bacterium]